MIPPVDSGDLWPACLTAERLADIIITSRKAAPAWSGGRSEPPPRRILPIYTSCQAEMAAMAVRTPEHAAAAGDTGAVFTLMSAVKPFLLLRILGISDPWQWTDRKPSALPFYSVPQLLADGGRPRNPMLNSGAMLLSDKLPGRNPEEQCARFVQWLNALAGTSLCMDGHAWQRLLPDGDDDNSALARELVRAGYATDARRMIDVYFRLCCLAGTINDAVRLGVVLTAARSDVPAAHQHEVLDIMRTCGLYEASAGWMAETGLPAKSGVSGVIIAAVPGLGAMAAFSPWLDSGGNSMLAREMLRHAALLHNRAASGDFAG